MKYSYFYQFQVAATINTRGAMFTLTAITLTLYTVHRARPQLPFGAARRRTGGDGWPRDNSDGAARQDSPKTMRLGAFRPFSQTHY
jgi:hypothetical protein